jgi:protein-S-isoprenylcysteine O-methyltransferase Ste14
MWMMVRQLASLLALPGVVAVVVPVWIARRNQIVFTAPHDLTGIAAVFCGVVLLATGGLLFAACLFYFWTRGHGTLAPWDPPRHFVVEGPYRFVRNPMISGVIGVLLGEAAVVRSVQLAEWAGVFVLLNMAYIPVLEEPMLVARFGEPYLRYKTAVRRFIPRLRPWGQTGGPPADAAIQ